MLHKAIALIALSSFISFAGYAEEPKGTDEDQQVQVQWTVAKEVQLAKCGCKRGKKKNQAEELKLAGCPCTKKDGTKKNEEEPKIIDEEEETVLAACGKCQPPKQNDADQVTGVEEEEEVEELIA